MKTTSTPDFSVLIVVPNLGGGGLERMALLLAEALRDAGARVTIFAHEATGALLDQVPEGVRFTAHAEGRYTRRRLPGLLAATLRQMRRHDIIIAGAEGRVSALCCLANILARRRLICWVHNDWREFSRDASNRALASLHMMRLASRIVAVSQGAAEGFHEITGIARNRIDVIHNGIDVAHVTRQAQAPLPAPLDGQIGPRSLLCVGRLIEQKGPDLLLEAYADLAPAHPDTRLVFVGSGPMLAALKARTKELSLNDQVLFAGYQPNPHPFFAAAGLFVLASRYEGFGLVLAEALACGARIVASDCRSGPREILDGGTYGDLVETGSVKALSAAIGRALDTAGPDPGILRARARDFDLAVFRAAWEAYIRDLSDTQAR